MESFNEISSNGIMEDSKDRTPVAITGYGVKSFFWEREL